ncbi:MAG TPA: class I SAM-dependent methyltransferase [Galbitalea sp.]|jgi:SAM-dependent methyltransferase
MPNNEYGDFQTPIELARQVIALLPRTEWTSILEPACGTGTFLKAAAEAFPDARRYGVELQPEYALGARAYGEIVVADALQIDFAGAFDWPSDGKLLVIGNPPWVTSADLTGFASANRPTLSNIRGLRGIEAMTGASNFDIAEAIILRLIATLGHLSPTIVLLCKTQVARNLLTYAAQFSLPISGVRLYGIDSKKWFGAGADACLLTFSVGTAATGYSADVYADLGTEHLVTRIGVVGDRLVSNLDAYERTRAADGVSPVTWWQGIKHDATQVMELVERDGPHTKSGVVVDVEAEYVYPLAKSTDVFRGTAASPRKWMLVPQQHTGDDTRILERTAPRLWAYLTDNGDALDGRRSSIYRGRPRFSIFGVGPYSFAPYKVAISAMHKRPVFRLVGPQHGRPVMFDDVCYFTPFEDVAPAALVTALLESAAATALLGSLSFVDAKRPVTKKLLQRLDLAVLATECSSDQLVARAAQLCGEVGERRSRDELAVSLDVLLDSWGRDSST